MQCTEIEGEWRKLLNGIFIIRTLYLVFHKHVYVYEYMENAFAVSIKLHFSGMRTGWTQTLCIVRARV